MKCSTSRCSSACDVYTSNRSPGLDHWHIWCDSNSRLRILPRGNRRSETSRDMCVICTTCIGRQCTRFERFLGAFLSWNMFHDSMLQRKVKKSKKTLFRSSYFFHEFTDLCIWSKMRVLRCFLTIFAEFPITNGEARYATVWGWSCPKKWYVPRFRKTRHSSNDEVNISKDRYRLVRKNDEKSLQGRLWWLDFRPL